MPNPAVGMVGAAVVGAVGSKSAADTSAGAAKDAANTAAASAAAELAFAKEQYADWTDVYGPIQDNLASYYSSLGPEYFETQGLEAFQKEQDLAFTRVQQSLEQRGVWDSGVGGAAELQKELAAAEGRAAIRAEAPVKATEAQRAFLQVGLGQDPTGDVQQALRSQTVQAGQVASQAANTAAADSAAAGQAFQTAATTAGTALGDYFAEKPTATTQVKPGV